jgi:hypothetical protein
LPISAILYIFYNADLIDKYNLADDTVVTGFIDDVAILVGSYDDGNMRQASVDTPDRRAVDKNPCLSLLASKF